MTKIEEYTTYNPTFYWHDKQKGSYDKSFWCNEHGIIHGSLKSKLKCKSCITEFDKLEHEYCKRIEWLFDNYRLYNISNFSKITTEELCKKFNLKISHFRPWL